MLASMTPVRIIDQGEQAYRNTLRSFELRRDGRKQRVLEYYH
jgi:hypothetical protein